METMKKVGIVTFYKNYNYGSALQSFALTKFVKKLGHDAYLIDYYDMSKSYNRRLRLKTYLGRLLYGCSNPKIFMSMLKGKAVSSKSIYTRSEQTRNKFDDFEKNKQKVFRENFTGKHIFDYFICGSDQVWKLSVPGLHYLFYLQFADANKRISYSASFGSDSVPRFNKKLLKKYLNGMKSISVREDTGVAIVKEAIGKDVPQVLDPVLLAGKEFWGKEINDLEPCESRQAYLLCYFLDPSTWSEEIINRIAIDKKLKVVWIDSGKNLLGKNHTVKNPDPLEFVQMIRGAECVCTDSFHGTAFSIMMETQFMIFDRDYEIYSEQKTRIESLLKLFSLEQRIFKKGDLMIESTIDFKKTSEVLRDEIEKSRSFLESSII